jgi:hypothetical protein
MPKKAKISLGILFVFLLSVFSTGCDLIKKDGGKTEATDFKRGPSGLVMQFVKNYPGDSYIASSGTEKILVMIDVRNKGTYPEGDHFSGGSIYISGFDDEIIDMTGLTDAEKGALTKEQLKAKQIENKTKKLSDSDMFLPAASPINPLGGFSTVEFEGNVIAENLKIDEYNPTILATACYPYATKASPTVCVDPLPFDDRQEKVCNIGSYTLPTQGAPVAITKIDQEAATGKIQFRISIKNVGDGDVLKPDDAGSSVILDKCSPFGRMVVGDFGETEIETLDRRDFDRVKVKSIRVGNVDLWNSDETKNKCSPFADGSNDIIRLFNGEGFVICTLNVEDLGSAPSAYTTPLYIELEYNYRSTISKPIKISKLTTVGG